MSESNADQQRFWSEDAGPSWVARMDAMDRTLAPVLDAVLGAADLQPGEKVIDIGCGAGTSSFAAGALVGEKGAVLGADISNSLVQAARDRAADHPNVQFDLTDVQTADFSDTAYDCLISRFGVMFFEDPELAFRNMSDALAPAGRMAFATWGAIRENPYFTLPSQVASEVIGTAPKVDPDLPGPFSLREVERLQNLLEQAKMEEISVQEMPMMLTPEGSAADVADLLCDIGAAQRILLHFQASQSDRARLVQALTQALAPFETPDGVCIPALINIVTARKPA